MQDKNQTDVRKILLAIAEHLNVDKIRGLAKRLDIPEGTMYAWIKRGNIGNTGSILGKVPYLNLEWLKSGEGPMMIIDKDNIDQLPNYCPEDKDGPIKPKISARIEPGNDKQWKRIGRQRDNGKAEEVPQAEAPDRDSIAAEQWSISDMLVMTTTVLESNTIYKTAMASNVRAFYEAVKNEENLRLISNELEELRFEKDMIKSENQLNKNVIEKLTERLLSFGVDVNLENKQLREKRKKWTEEKKTEQEEDKTSPVHQKK